MAHQLKKGGKEALCALADELKSGTAPSKLSRQPSPMSVRTEVLKRQTVRRTELKRLVPLSDTTIYELEQKGEFPKRFYLTPRCVVWPLNEILNWLDERKAASQRGEIQLAPAPDVRLRASRPVQ